MFGIFNVHTDVQACDCTRRLYRHRKRACTESWLWEKKSLAAPENRTYLRGVPVRRSTNWATSPPQRSDAFQQHLLEYSRKWKLTIYWVPCRLFKLRIRQTDRQIDPQRQTVRQTDGQTERQTERKTESYGQTETVLERLIDLYNSTVSSFSSSLYPSSSFSSASTTNTTSYFLPPQNVYSSLRWVYL